MPSNGFVSRNNASVGARAVRGKLAALLAACLVCGATGNGNTAANPSDDFGAIPFLAPASPAPADDSTAPSFKERFDVSQPSRIHEVLAGLIYYLPQEELTTASLPPPPQIVAAGDAIVGIASTYNPTDPKDQDAGNEETASGEKYDVKGWTAAIRTDLRAQFGGVRFGRNYRPVFALVQAGDKKIIVRINDVGPLRPGRIIDLNDGAMRYFDPTMQAGLIADVKVTPLAGQDWALGPIDDDRLITVASLFDR
jgi:rare lipoprotein A